MWERSYGNYCFSHLLIQNLFFIGDVMAVLQMFYALRSMNKISEK